jgi:microcin C transport system permease protein
MPVLFLLIILSSIIEPSFSALLILMLLFSWMGLVAFVRAEFLRLRNFDFVRASKALGASDFRIMLKHILPNASPVIIANLPFLIAGAITTLASLDFLGLGLPAGSPSLGELLAQGKNNIAAPWLGITGFVVVTLILTLLVFIGEAFRDAFDSRKNS